MGSYLRLCEWLFIPIPRANLFGELFSEDFMPHGHCFFWRADILSLHVISDATIALAYFSIPIALMYFARRRKDLDPALSWLLVAFGTFILCCGLTHLMEVWTIWHPNYVLSGMLKAITAIVSVVTAACVWPYLPKALSIPNPRELQAANRELAETNERLSTNERLKDEFMANVSHELRTPLTLILSPLESVLAEERERLSQNSQKLLETVHNNAVRLLQVVTSLLDFARLEAKALAIRPVSVNIPELLKEITGDFQQLALRKNLQLQVHFDSNVQNVITDPYLLERILFNLLSNAVKFTETGSITVELRAAIAKIQIDVKDTGIGIAKENIPILFERFRQLEGSATRRFDGVGLGLALAKELAILLGGNLEVESEDGVGSTFTLSLFNRDGASPSQPPTILKPSRYVEKYDHDTDFPDPNCEEPDEMQGRSKILIVEDSNALAIYVEQLLGKRYSTKIARDGIEALEVLESWEADLILSDVMMPRMDGFELCRVVRSKPEMSNTPIVLLTALTHREALLSGWEAGADEYLFKPFHPTELLTRVRTLLAFSEERLRTERLLRLANEDLEARVEERSKELLTRNAELELMNRRLEEFNYMASHDLREPLRMVVFFSQLLEKDYKDLLDQKGKECISLAVDGAMRAQQLVTCLLEYSRIGMSKKRHSLVDCNEIFKIACQNLTLRIRESQATVTNDKLPTLWGDEAQLTQLFQNIIDNAIKFRGEVTTPTVHVRYEHDENAHKILFEDNGIGIEPQYRDRIFDLFRRLHPRDKYPGVGVGLAMCRQIVTNHKGRIWIDDNPGGGSIFSVWLPELIEERTRLEENSEHESSGVSMT